MQGCRMRATVKLAAVCVSLLMAAHADAVGQRNQASTASLQERGVRLRLELERAYRDLRHTGNFKSAGNDVSPIVKKYVPVGASLADAERILRGAGFDMAPPPEEPPRTPSPSRSDENKAMTVAIFATLVLARRGVSRITVEVKLLQKKSGDDRDTVRGVHAAIHYRGI